MNPVYAAVDWGSCVQGAATIQCLEPLFGNVVGGVTAIATVGLFVMLLVGGFNFLFSGGDQKKLEVARGTLTNAIVGLVVIAVAYLIIKALSVITGVADLTKFVIPQQ